MVIEKYSEFDSTVLLDNLKVPLSKDDGIGHLRLSTTLVLNSTVVKYSTVSITFVSRLVRYLNVL